MLDSVSFYTCIVHLLNDAVFLVHEMLTEPFNFYAERVSAVLICSKSNIKWVDFTCLYAPLLSLISVLNKLCVS